MTHELSPRPPKLERIAESLSTGGLSLVRRAGISDTEQDDQTAEVAQLDEETIYKQTGYKIAFEMPHWQADGGARVGFHDELQHMGERYGWSNVVGSMFIKPDTGELSLGVFVHESALPAVHDE